MVREMKKIVGYTIGVYDMLHMRHLNILKRAKEQCDYLIVGVSTDELVTKEINKTPVIVCEERAEIVGAVRYVDEVVVRTENNEMAAWEKYHFDKMFVDSAWQGKPEWTQIEQQFKEKGVEVVYLSCTDDSIENSPSL